MNFELMIQNCRKRRFDNKPDKVIYYADGKYFDKWFMKYHYDICFGVRYIQSGYNSIEQLKQFKDFQQRGEM